jgi:hypothetical protein
MARTDAPFPASLFFSGPSPISQPHSSLISISTPSSPREHEAHKKVLSAFYVAHAILVEFDAEGAPKLATPSLLAEALSGRAPQFSPFFRL